MDAEVIIIGGGLSGLALADHLQRLGVDYLLLEARSRFGGRIKVAQVEGSVFDLGPSWFWPGQPRIADMVSRFGLTVTEQYSKGTLSFEDEHGDVQRGHGFSSMEGSYRLKGGMNSLVTALVAGLAPNKIRVNAAVTAIHDNGHITVDLADGQSFTGNKIVLAVPPRVAATFDFQPALPATVLGAMAAIPTWMAGHAKFVAVYDRAFWRDDGLSGDAMSRHGPLAEIHDATDANTQNGALFGFVGVLANIRAGQGEAVKAAAVAQLGRLFGKLALSPSHVFYQDWAMATETATAKDFTPPNSHPNYGLPDALTNLWDGRLQMGSSEMAGQFGGYLEGALEIAEHLAVALSD